MFVFCAVLILMASLLATASPATAKKAPKHPTAIVASRLDSAVILTWRAPRRGGAAKIRGYQIRYSTDGGRTWSAPAARVRSKASSTTVRGLGNGAPYTFQVRALRKSGKSRWSKKSAPVSLVAAQPPVAAPAALPVPATAPATTPIEPATTSLTGAAAQQPAPSPTPTTTTAAPKPTATPTPTPTPTPTQSQTAPPPAGSWWAPTKGTSWQWQLTGTIDTSVDAAVFDIDGEDSSAATVAALHAKGAKVICYFSAGSYENWRKDAASFPAAVRGKGLDGWAGESWLDVRRLDVLLPIMEARIANCKAKGFDAVEPDNVDGDSNSTGFPLTAADQATYNKALADIAHRHGLGIALKNDPDQVKALEPFFDFSVAEECAKYNECDAYAPFTAAGKAVLHVEYSGTLASFCPTTKALGFSSLLKKLNLDAWRSPCP